MRKRPLIIAHRGHCIDIPEQTIAAYSKAVELGAEMIEADVQFTRDGKLVMLHDGTLDRTTSGRGLVSQHDWSEVQKLDAGSWFGRAFSGERVPLLADLFALAEETGIALCIEVKGESPAEFERIALAVAAEMKRRNRLDIDVMASFDHAALAKAADVTPGLRTAPDRLPERGPSVARDIIEQARYARATIIQHHHADLDAGAIAELQQAGFEIWAWPTTARNDIARAMALGVDGLMGDDVAAIVEVVSSQAAGPIT